MKIWIARLIVWPFISAFVLLALFGAFGLACDFVKHFPWSILVLLAGVAFLVALKWAVLALERNADAKDPARKDMEA